MFTVLSLLNSSGVWLCLNSYEQKKNMLKVYFLLNNSLLSGIEVIIYYITIIDTWNMCAVDLW